MQMLKCGYLVLVVLLAAAATAEEGGEETLAALKEADNDRGMVMGDGEEKPNKTTTTTTVAPPTTVPKEKVPTFFLAEEGYNCIILKGQITFHIVYEDPKKNMNITVPHDARVSGTCALNTTSPTKAVPTGEDERISLAFDGGKGQGKERVSFVFSGKKEVTKTTGRYALYQVCYDDSCGNLTGFAVNNDMAYVCTPSSTYKDVLNTTDGGMVSLTLASFEAQAFTNSTTFKDGGLSAEGLVCMMNYMAYGCTPSSTYKDVLNTTDGGMVSLTLAGFEAQAFTNSTTFKDEFQCSAMRSNDLVPIIVGSCLAALVVFVLIAYLIGRARAKNSTGYESV